MHDLFCVGSPKSSPIPAYSALELSDCPRSHTGVFVWTCLNIDFAKRLTFLKGRRIDLAGANASAASRLRGEIDHALQVTFGKRGIAQSALSFNERGVLLRVQIRSPFDRLLGADESRNDEIPDALMPLVHTTELIVDSEQPPSYLGRGNVSYVCSPRTAAGHEHPGRVLHS
jgi:hypothetical protein